MTGRGVTALLALAALAGLLTGCGDDKKVHLEGKRISVLALDKRLVADPKLDGTPISLPAPYANPAWPEAGGYPNHAMYHLALGEKIRRAWRSGIGDGDSRYGRVIAQPVVADGVVFAMDAQTKVSAYDAKSGDRLWRFDIQPKDVDESNYGGGVAYADGKLYVATGYAEVIALDAKTGKPIWRVPVSGPVHGSPTVADGRIFAITIDNQLEVLATTDGRLLWSHNGIPEPASLLGSASPAVEGDTVVVPYSSGEIFALRVGNGQPVWSDNLATSRPLGALSSLADIRGQPVIDRGRVIAVSHAGILVSIDLRTGDRVWEQDIGGTHSPWVAGDFIYVLSNDSDLVCLTREDGRVRWVRELPRFEDEDSKSDPERWAGPVLAGDRLIVVSSSGEAFSVSPYTGEALGWTEFPDGVYVNPVVADQTLFVVTDDADLIALR
ncbi:MAG TPA: PQQ-binding-like beta-propeller repeat protein [Stellaceae bacterium]|jgi:outer membrane protein assembly factor BamB|nr:PQQ-binding-like beta-propeller repeat protein [Stellaceae bacterium]